MSSWQTSPEPCTIRVGHPEAMDVQVVSHTFHISSLDNFTFYGSRFSTLTAYVVCTAIMGPFIRNYT